MSPELSRPQRLDALPPGGLERKVEADTAERAAVAGRLQVPGIAALCCDWRLVPFGGGGVVAAEGRLRARVTRECVITLDEFEEQVDERFVVHFVPAGREERDIDPESPDEVPYEGAAADLGEATVEQLALAIDPYPRKPGAALPEPEPPREHPFAALGRTRR